jgi:hypothetical protein
VDHFLALVRFNVFDSALRASIVATATPNVGPLFTIIRTAVIVNELRLGHHFLRVKPGKNYRARD